MAVQAHVLLLLIGTVLAAGTEDSDKVTCSLQDYQNLYRQAHRQALESDLQDERQELRKAVELQKQELKQEIKASKDTAANTAASRSQRQKIFPGNWQLVKHVMAGSCHLDHAPDERSMASYNVTLEFRIFEDSWTAIPLIDAQTIVADWRVERDADGDSVPMQLGQDTFLTLRQREEVKDEEPWDDHTLVTNTSGLYRIMFQAFVPIRSDRHLNGLQLNLLHPLMESSLRIKKKNGHVHIKELSVEPFAQLETFESGNETIVKMRHRSTKVLSMKWRLQSGGKDPKVMRSKSEKEDLQEEEDPVQESAQATVVHDAIHSIDDSVLESFHHFKYSLDSEQSLKIEIHFFGSARVTSVVAHGMKTWRVAPFGNRSMASETGIDQEPETVGTVLQVEFKSSAMSKDVVVMVATETEFDAERKLLDIPQAVCQGALRQSGTLAIVKVANVEIYEQSVSGAARTGSDSIPSQMKGRTGQPIVLAYKFLAPRFAVTLSVIHHEELPILEAAADAALYKALVVDTQMMNIFLLRLQNTQRQYMEVHGIPADATLWSLKVNSVSTKAVRGRGGSLLVPLLIGAGSASGAASMKTSVELAWLMPIEPLGNNGTLELNPPRVDMPVSALSVEIQFPENYVVNFTGSLKRVNAFSGAQPNPVSHETGEEVVEKGFDFGSASPPKTRSVRAKLPQAGSRYRFEKLLVINGSATLSALYGQPVVHESGWLAELKSALYRS